MAFGRRKKDSAEQEAAAPAQPAEESAPAGGDSPQSAEVDGPFDIEDFDNQEEAALARLDLGSVLIPMPPGGQVQVELTPTGAPSAIWVVTPHGRFTIAAYAAPKSPGLWREVAAELADALRNDNASVSIQDGPWGREVVGTGAGVVRFIGVDGFRWMIRCVVNGSPESMDALVVEARAALNDTVVRRGDTPLPVRTPLPVQLPEPLAEQLRAAAAQQAQQAQQAMLAAQQAMLAQQQFAQQTPPPGTEPQPEPQPEPEERRAADGSAMQQLRGSGP